MTRVRLVGVALCIAVSALSVHQPVALASPTNPVQAISLANPNLPVSTGGDGHSSAPEINADGRFAVFLSAADNLVTNQQNRSPLSPIINVFLREFATGKTTLISANNENTDGGNGDSNFAAISADGRFVVFESKAGNLVTNDTNNATDVFVRDVIAGKTILVSVNADGTASGNGSSTDPVMTPDGHFVAFSSDADDLVAGDTNAIRDVFVRDLMTGAITLVSVGAQGQDGSPSGSDAPAISGDGNFVAFASTATGIATGLPVNNSGQLFIRDIKHGSTIWVNEGISDPINTKNFALSADGKSIAFMTSEVTAGSGVATETLFWRGLASGTNRVITTFAQANAHPLANENGPVLSANGQIVCYVGWGENPTDFTIPTSVFVWNAETGSNTLVNVNLARSGAGNGIADTPRLSADGSVVAFLSTAKNLVTNITSGEFQLYIRDLTRDETSLVSVNEQGNASSKGDMLQPSLSADGRRVAFATSDSGSVTNDLNQATDVFVQDPVIGTTELVSVRDAGFVPKTGNGASRLNRSAFSADGRFVVFMSTATNLVDNDTNGLQDVFLRDLSLGTTLLVSVNKAGSGSGSGVSYSPAITPNGRFVVFVSTASDLVDNDTNRSEDVFVRDIQTGTTTLVSMNGPGTSSGNGPSNFPVISADGSLVAFLSQATDLVADPLNVGRSLYVRDLRARATYLAASGSPSSISPPSLSADGRLLAYGIAGGFNGLYVWDTQLRTNIATNPAIRFRLPNAIISADGRRVVYEQVVPPRILVYDIATHSNTPVSLVFNFVAFDSVISGDGDRVAFVSDVSLLAEDTNGLKDVYVFDLPTGASTLVSINASGTASGNGGSDAPFISNDGRFVAFRSEASDLVSEDTHGAENVFVRDLQTGTTTLLSRNSVSSGNAWSSAPVMSGDKSLIAFASLASDFVPGDLNSTVDLFYTRLNLDTGGFRLNASFSASDGNVTLRWSPQTGKTYRVQFKHDLNEAVWSELAMAPVESNGSASVIDTSPIRENQRFYRVVELP